MISSWQMVDSTAFAPNSSQYATLCQAQEIFAPPTAQIPQFCPQHPVEILQGWDGQDPSYFAQTAHRVRLLDDATYHAYSAALLAHPAAYQICSLERDLPADLARLHQQQEQEKTGPLAGWDVLVPRPPQQATKMLELLAAQGAAAWAVPTIAIKLEQPRPQLALEEYSWAIATSTNAVDALRNTWPQAPAGLRWAAVGAKTAQSLEDWGARVSLQPPATAQTAQGLLEVFPKPQPASPGSKPKGKPPKIWYPRADIAKPALASGLRAAGWQVEEVVAYRNTKAPGIPAGLLHTLADPHRAHRLAVCVTAGSTIKNLIELAGALPKAAVLATIGPRASEACAQMGLEVSTQSPVASAEALVQALVGAVLKSA